MVNRVVDDAEAVDRALELGNEIANNGSLAVRMAKATMSALSRPSEAAAMTVESMAQAVLFDSEYEFQRMDAFLARKKK